jgi:NADH:ubiquinone oxidoreductase subunit C
VSRSLSDWLRRLGADLDLEFVSVSEGSCEALRVSLPGSQIRALLEGLIAADGAPSIRLLDLTVVDRRDEVNPRLEVVYRFETEEPSTTLRVHASLATEGGEQGTLPEIDSVVRLLPAAGWLEREASEFFGLHFRGAVSAAPLLLGPDVAPPLQRGGDAAHVPSLGGDG